MHADSKKPGLQVDAPGLEKKILDERDGMQAKIEQLHGRFQLLEDAEVSLHQGLTGGHQKFEVSLRSGRNSQGLCPCLLL